MARAIAAGSKSKKPPAELAEIWTDDVKTAWGALSLSHQGFLIAYINTNYNASEAYRRTYNDKATPDVASSGGSQILRNSRIKQILAVISDTLLEDMLLVRTVLVEAATVASKGETEAGDIIPDYPTRIKAAAELRDYHRPKGTDAPPPAPAMPTQFVGQFNFYLQQMGMMPLQLPIPTEAETVDAEPAESFGASFQQFAKK